MKRFLFAVSSVMFFPVMVAVNSWFFRARFGISYIDWYIANGTLIGIAASLFTVVWKNLNDNQGLIAADPRAFLAANLLLIGTQFQVSGHYLDEAGARLRAHRPIDRSPGSDVHGSSELRPAGTGSAIPVTISDLLDGVGGLLATALMVTAMTVWFIAIVPLQYFIVLIAGAPARLALKLQDRVTGPIGSSNDEPPDSSELKKWEGNLVSAPVSMTNAVAALIVLAVKLARSIAA